MASTITPESIDLAELTSRLDQRLSKRPPVGYLEGRTMLRDMVTEELTCSELDAEEVVDTLIGQGFFRFSGDPESASRAGAWEADLGAS